MPEHTVEEAAKWRVTRLLEQREAFSGWIREATGTSMSRNLGDSNNNNSDDDSKNDNNNPREHLMDWDFCEGCKTVADVAPCIGMRTAASAETAAALLEDKTKTLPVVAAVSSAGMAYVHEYVAIDPTVRIVVVMRPREEVVVYFFEKVQRPEPLAASRKIFFHGYLWDSCSRRSRSARQDMGQCLSRHDS